MRHFNPRSREGSDIFSRSNQSGIVISIHAPAKGATKLIGGVHGDLAISIHAPAKGATVNGYVVRFHPTISIHAPAKGATSMVVVSFR